QCLRLTNSSREIDQRRQLPDYPAREHVIPSPRRRRGTSHRLPGHALTERVINSESGRSLAALRQPRDDVLGSIPGVSKAASPQKPTVR
ncbi:MAG TPA: hypothetical protein VG095_02935, partial [Chthoniobacterales bacterium]|nr:hypothetical protein [Chthoniobacterales bacterium]